MDLRLRGRSTLEATPIRLTVSEMPGKAGNTWRKGKRKGQVLLFTDQIATVQKKPVCK